MLDDYLSLTESSQAAFNFTRGLVDLLSSLHFKPTRADVILGFIDDNETYRDDGFRLILDDHDQREKNILHFGNQSDAGENFKCVKKSVEYIICKYPDKLASGFHDFWQTLASNVLPMQLINDPDFNMMKVPKPITRACLSVRIENLQRVMLDKGGCCVVRGFDIVEYLEKCYSIVRYFIDEKRIEMHRSAAKKYCIVDLASSFCYENLSNGVRHGETMLNLLGGQEINNVSLVKERLALVFNYINNNHLGIKEESVSRYNTTIEDPHSAREIIEGLFAVIQGPWYLEKNVTISKFADYLGSNCNEDPMGKVHVIIGMLCEIVSSASAKEKENEGISILCDEIDYSDTYHLSGESGTMVRLIMPSMSTSGGDFGVIKSSLTSFQNLMYDAATDAQNEWGEFHSEDEPYTSIYSETSTEEIDFWTTWTDSSTVIALTAFAVVGILGIGFVVLWSVVKAVRIARSCNAEQSNEGAMKLVEVHVQEESERGQRR